jgi:uncharacterized protein
MATEVRKAEERSCYELLLDGEVVGTADYRIEGDTVVLPHTVIARAHRNRGLGAELVRAVLDDIRPTGRRVVPVCWYVAEFIETNPDYADLVA